MDITKQFRTKNGVSFSDEVGVGYTANDPRVGGETALVGSILIRKGASGESEIYQKIGNGDTDWYKRTIRMAVNTTDPLPTTDSDSGYSVFDQIINSTNNNVFICTDATVGSAVWANLTSSSGGTTTSYGTSDATFTLADAVSSLAVSGQPRTLVLGIVVVGKTANVTSATRIECFLTQVSSGDVRACIYDSEYNLVAYSDAITNPSTGINTFTLNNATAKTFNTGEKYYAGIITNINSLYFAGISSSTNFNVTPYLTCRVDNLSTLIPASSVASLVNQSVDRPYMGVFY